jgi:hypothetical protein
MLPGPVFNFELLGTSRRARFYLVRAFYAAILFVMLWAIHITTLLLINITGQGVLNALCRFGFAPQLWPGFTPYEISKLLPDLPFFQHLSSVSWPRSWWLRDIDDGLAWQTIANVLSVLGYAALATLLTWETLRRFEVVASRARRSRETQPAARAHGKAVGSSK